MPWHIENNYGDCDGWAVVKDNDGSIAGCHDSEDSAKAQLAALYANERSAGDIERRYVDAELRALTGEDGLRLTGYAARFNVWSDDLGGFRETIRPGAFKDSLRDDVRALLNHDPNYVLGRTTNGTLSLREDEGGLRVEVTLPDTSYARDLHYLVQRGDITQMSFAFRAAEGGEDWATVQGQSRRTLRKVRLYDVSPVTFPAYPQTSVYARSMAQRLNAHGDQEIVVIDAAPPAASQEAARRERKLRILALES